jgi:hypothetical protein
MKKSSKKKSLKFFKNSNKNFKFEKCILIYRLIFSRPIFFEVLKNILNYGGMNLEMEKNVNYNII